jgi:hypothetical protein
MTRKMSPEAQVKASGIKVGDLVRYEDMKFGGGYEQSQARVTDFWFKHGEATVSLDNGEWRYLNEVRKV